MTNIHDLQDKFLIITDIMNLLLEKKIKEDFITDKKLIEFQFFFKKNKIKYGSNSN